MDRKGIWILTAILLGIRLDVAAAEEVTDNTAPMEQKEEAKEAADGAEEEEHVWYSVSFPADIHAFLDPGNLSGKGQIFSDCYAVENHGNTEVTINIKNIDVYYASAEDVYEFSDEEIKDHTSGVKKMNIGMVWGKENEESEKILYLSEGVRDEEVLTLEASDYDEDGEFVSLKEGSTGYFYFTGTLNANPNIEWEEGELIIRFDYEISGTGEEPKASEQPGGSKKEEDPDHQEDVENTVSSEIPEGEKDQAADNENAFQNADQKEDTEELEPSADEEVKKSPEESDETAGADTENADPEEEPQRPEETDPEEESQQTGETDSGDDVEKRNDIPDTEDAFQSDDQDVTLPEGEVSGALEGADQKADAETEEIQPEEGTSIHETDTEAAGQTGNPGTGTGP